MIAGECEWTDSAVSVASSVTTEGRVAMLLVLRSLTGHWEKKGKKKQHTEGGQRCEIRDLGGKIRDATRSKCTRGKSKARVQN